MMSEESLQVKDLPDAEKQAIFESFKQLHLSGSPLKMEVNAAKELIAKKQQENIEAKGETVIVNNPVEILTTQETQEAQENVQTTEGVIEQTAKESDGKCIICHSPVYDGICSGCKTRFRG